MDLGMIHHKLHGRGQFVRVHQRHKGQHRRKGGRRKHELDHAQIAVALEHATLKLTGEAVKEQIQDQEHHTGPCGADFFSEVIVSKSKVVRRSLCVRERGRASQSERVSSGDRYSHSV